MNNLIPSQNFLSTIQPQDLASIPPESVWLENFTSQKTIETYKRAVGHFLVFAGIENSEQIKTVKRSHVLAWRKHLQQNGYSPRSINNRLSAVSSLFKSLCEEQHMKINPAVGVKRLRVNQNTVETPIMTTEQARMMLDAPEGDSIKALRDRAILHTLFHTGCRINEPTLLKVGDFFSDAEYFVLDFTVKGGKKNRVAIHQELQVALRRYLKANGHEDERESPLFVRLQPKGSRAKLTNRQLMSIFHQYRKKVGLPAHITPHSARATFITHTLENPNTRIEQVQKTVGHSSITTTQAYDKRKPDYRESASFKASY